MATARTPPSWDQLYETASSQEGLFTTRQAADAGYSPQLIMKYLRSGKMVRVRRGIYRLVHFPPGEHEDLVAIWLWTEQEGVFSHETALALHGLSDVLPSRAHLTLPATWSSRRLRVPKGVVLHHETLHERETAWVGSVSVTSPARTLTDCIAAHVSPELIEQAIEQATRRGLIGRSEAQKIHPASRPRKRS